MTPNALLQEGGAALKVTSKRIQTSYWYLLFIAAVMVQILVIL